MSKTNPEMAPEQGDAEALLELREVTRSYGALEVLRDVSLSVAPGHCIALTGSNGSGKSTLLRLAAGRERPTSGTVLFDGAPIDGDARAVRAAVATVMDVDAFYPDLTVREHLMLVALAHGLGGSAPDAVDRVLSEHHLTGHADLLPSALSSGLRQQMLLSAAFVRPHRLLVVDEPEQRLDAAARQELSELLVRHKARGVSILMASHHEQLVEAVADLVLELEDGRTTHPGGASVAMRTPSDALSSTCFDGTEEVLRFLRAVRSDYRAERRKRSAFVAYLVVLFGGVWGVPGLLTVARLGRPSGLDHSMPLLQALPLWLPALLSLASLLLVRSAVWRGPAVVDSATVSWLLPHPIARAQFLLPRVASAATIGSLLGVLSGGVLGFLLADVSGAGWLAVTVAGAWAGLGTGLASTGLSVLVVRHEGGRARQQRVMFRAGWCAVALLCLLSAVALIQGLPAWVGTTVLWLSPWGWASQPLTAAVSGTAPGWPLAMLLWACSVAVTVLLGVRAVPDIPGESLRLRAALADRMGASLFSLDLRQMRSAMRVRQDRVSRPAVRLEPPRARWLVVPWRDALSLLRAPGRLGWGCAWSALSTTAFAFASARHGSTAALSCCASVWFLYLAAAQLVEPARLDSDDLRRGNLLPYRSGTLALWHAVVPGALLTVTSGLGLLVCAAGGWWSLALPATLAAIPASVGTALVGAYRGPVPFHLLVGTDTAMGNTAPIQTAVWYLRGLLALMSLTTPVMTTTADRAVGPQDAVLLLTVGAAALWWARHTARKLQG
ncbi:DUF6297 family protein [Streptomyces sp. TG1A-8]|uniref:DUF6297 family protein n=1 Tax=Streptomyces sp. TG1A-8 TaxID=3051385 RepID=UPI00265C5047|nr:DUF6297 family protein [Streptomyces sp. TG1A-8]MDO0929786.1 DUF6297 family protein [Streptomyces sp. TG1A-8]